MKSRSRVLDPPLRFGLVPNVIFWRRWWESEVSISLFNMYDSGALPWRRVPSPSCHEALGKLKSPARMISGVGVGRFAIEVFRGFIIVFSKDLVRCGPLYLSAWS